MVRQVGSLFGVEETFPGVVFGVSEDRPREGVEAEPAEISTGGNFLAEGLSLFEWGRIG